ncbi:MAG TPA: mechanosensitive ion channel family protein [Xanthobacteraceae bacterium]|nr:mechanosensitive ion channel family protein [Xanthobacteraceae bacterium]
MWQDLTQNAQAELSALGHALAFAPPWAVSFVVLVTAVAVAWLIHAVVLALVHRLLPGQRPYLRSILDATKNPTRLGLLLLAFAIALPTTPLDAETKSVLAQCLVLATICLLGWIALTALHIGANLYLLRFRIDVDDNLVARKHLTQVRVLTRALDTVIVLVTLGFALMTFAAVRQYGVSLFASAGIAGVIFGLAAQPLLSNLIAGVQLAVTQPIRLEDAVTVQNEYGWIEEINATYVVVRLWDLRRLIVPLNYFIQQPFYNWSRQSATTIGSVLLYLDYTAPVDVVRKKAAELVAQSGKDNAKVTNVQVTNTTAQAIEVRVLVSSDSAATTSNVCAALREQLIAFLQHEHPEALPRGRSETVGPPAHKKDGPAEPPGARSDRPAT